MALESSILSGDMKLIVAQVGARMHYAVPRILYRAGMLDRLFTDICAVKGWPRMLNLVPEALRPSGLRRLLSRVPEGIPPGKITAFSGFGWQFYRRRAQARTPSQLQDVYDWEIREFCRLVLQSGLTGADGVFTFCYAGLELLQAANSQGKLAIMEQFIAPYVVAEQLPVEREQYPHWEQVPGDLAQSRRATERLEQEWQTADMIICGSAFVRDAIATHGGPAEKCAVVPYGVDMHFQIPARTRHHGPLRVLTVGTIGLRKGSPYVLEAAKLMGDSARFRMVGPIEILPAAEAELRKHVELVGSVPRSQIVMQYAWADVFVLPSICEGSATVTYEALAAGLPVICTPNAGSVVRDGIDGFIVPVRRADVIVKNLNLLRNEDLLACLSQNARARAAEFTLNQYSQRLIAQIVAARLRKGNNE